MYKALPLE
ncbi:hypothetical protein VTH06DRAFT_7948 [Thermothelomyces fergusii]